MVIFKFLVFISLIKGILYHSKEGIPILVSTKFSFSISECKFPDDVSKFISSFPYSFDKSLATHLVPFPQAPEMVPSEL